MRGKNCARSGARPSPSRDARRGFGKPRWPLAHGHPGIAGYRARFEVDNVIVSNATRLAVRFDTWERSWADGWYQRTPGNWQLASVPDSDVDGDGEENIYVLRQSESAGDVKWFSKIAIGNQVVSARVKPVSFGATTGTQDPWVGVAAQVKDDRNYYYVTLRRSNQLSLRRMVNGTIQTIATVAQPVSTGAWYDLRLEIVGTNLRAYVNGDLKIQTTDSTLSGGGRNALLMYKTAADWESYIAYQP